MSSAVKLRSQAGQRPSTIGLGCNSLKGGGLTVEFTRSRKQAKPAV